MNMKSFHFMPTKIDNDRKRVRENNPNFLCGRWNKVNDFMEL